MLQELGPCPPGTTGALGACLEMLSCSLCLCLPAHLLPPACDTEAGTCGAVACCVALPGKGGLCCTPFTGTQGNALWVSVRGWELGFPSPVCLGVCREVLSPRPDTVSGGGAGEWTE